MPLQIVRQDITKMQVDAIVNSTNEQMNPDGGIDFAIHKAAGHALYEECRALVPLGLGEAKLTRGYNLPCKYVIHTSGPVWRGGFLGESVLLRSCYTESLRLALKYGCRTVALPLISSGTYGYPKEQVLRFAVQTISDFLFENEMTVYLCVFDRESYKFSETLYRDIYRFICGENNNEPAHDVGYAPSYMMPKPTADEETSSSERREREGLRKKEKSLPKTDNALSFLDEHDDSFEFIRKRVRSSSSDKISRLSEPTVIEKNEAVSMSLSDYLKRMDKSFAEMLFDLIDERDMSDVECYKKANVDKRTFSKIKSNKDYKPSKPTAVAFAISLELDLDTAQELLKTAGFTLSESKLFDKIILYFIQNGNYNIFEINEALFEFDQTLLGSV